MQTISLRGKVDKDGILRLEVPFGAYGEEVEVIVVVQSGRTPSLRELAGIIDDETLVEPDELPFEKWEYHSDAWLNRINSSYGSCADDPIERPDQKS